MLADLIITNRHVPHEITNITINYSSLITSDICVQLRVVINIQWHITNEVDIGKTLLRLKYTRENKITWQHLHDK